MTNSDKCRDCGERLDVFGICPNADVNTVMTHPDSPVYCGHETVTYGVIVHVKAVIQSTPL